MCTMPSGGCLSGSVTDPGRPRAVCPPPEGIDVAHPPRPDSYIAGFKIRYVYNFCRPVTAIREGDNDGNDGQRPDPGQPPEHASRLGLSVDAEHIQRRCRRYHAIVHQLLPGAGESADSRVYAGIHFRSACEDGPVPGRKIGQRVVALYLQPIRK